MSKYSDLDSDQGTYDMNDNFFPIWGVAGKVADKPSHRHCWFNCFGRTYTLQIPLN